MEMSSLTSLTLPSASSSSSSSSRPLSFFNNGFKLHSPTISRTTTTCNSLNHQTKKRKPFQFQVQSLNGSQTQLSSKWDASISPATPLLPSFEELDTTNMLLRQRIVFLGSEVDDATADFVITQLLLLDAKDSTKDIKLFINSPGGSISAGMGIYDAMKLCKADVSTVCLGLAASMGGFLLAAGTKGKRYCMPNSKVMIHEPIGLAGGGFLDVAIRGREMNYHKWKIIKILSRITGKPEKQIEKDTERDKFMSPWEAKDYGLIDAVIDDGKPGLVAPYADTIVPPPKPDRLDLWLVEPRFRAKNTPSEDKFLKSRRESSDEDKDKDTQQAVEAQSSV